MCIEILKFILLLLKFYCLLWGNHKTSEIIAFYLISTVLEILKWEPCKYELQVNEVNAQKISDNM